MKVLFSIRNKEIFNYHESVIESLSRNGHKIHLVFSENNNSDRIFTIDPNPIERIKSLKNVSFEFLNSKRNLIQKFNFNFREIMNYLNYYEKPYKKNNQHSFYQKRWEKPLPVIFRFIFTKLQIGKITIFRKIFKLCSNILELISGHPLNHVQIINDFNPDVIIGTPCNLRFSEEIDFIKYGKYKKLHTIITILSWDNLTTKGGFAILPDEFFAWNETHKDELIEFHNIDKEIITICGSPFFDKWFDDKFKSFDKEQFQKLYNMKSNDSYLLYLGSSKNLGKYDEVIIDELLENIRFLNKKNKDNLILLIKPHSTNKSFLKKYIKSPDIRLWNSNYKWVKEQSLFRYTLRNAKFSIGLNTTALIDSVINNCQVISIIHDKLKYEPTHSAIHFKNIIDSEIYQLINNVDNLEMQIDKLIIGKEKFKISRDIFLSKFVRPKGISLNVGDITNNEIEKNIKI